MLIKHQTIVKSKRMRTGADMHRDSAPILRSITRDPETLRVRELKPGENKQSMYDYVISGSVTFKHVGDNGTFQDGLPPEFTYDEDDALEDQVLFPGEQDPIDQNGFLESGKPLRKFEQSGPILEAFALDLDSEEDLSEAEDDLRDSECESDESRTDLEDSTTSDDEADNIEAEKNADSINDEEDKERCNPEEASNGDEKVGSEQQSYEILQYAKNTEILLSKWKASSPPEPEEEALLEQEYLDFIDRHKTKGMLVRR